LDTETRAAGYPVFKQLRAQPDAHPLNRAEAEMRRLMRHPPE
jgi:hypothetical protein